MSFPYFDSLLSESFLFLHGVYLLVSLVLFYFVMALIRFWLELIGALL